MKKSSIICFLILFVLGSCGSKEVFLYVHKTDKNDGDIFGYPKYGFFYDKSNPGEITKYTISFTRQEQREIKRLLDTLRTKEDLDYFELNEGPHDKALIVGNDTLYGYVDSWMWKNKIALFKSSLLKNKFKKYLEN